MKAGASNAVRGSSAPVEELQYIYANSRSVGAVIESPALLQSLYASGGLTSQEGGKPQFIVVLYPKGETGQTPPECKAHQLLPALPQEPPVPS